MYLQYHIDNISHIRMYSDINAWKTHHLWNQRRLFILKIHKLTPLPLSIAEMVSDFCFHSDILVTTNKNKLVGIYPDTARLHTVAEFSKSITGITIMNTTYYHHCEIAIAL